jgi:hypothetical protein
MFQKTHTTGNTPIDIASPADPPHHTQSSSKQRFEHKNQKNTAGVDNTNRSRQDITSNLKN